MDIGYMSKTSYAAPTDWYSMEIQTFVLTANGREIRMSKLTNVLSFCCVCPICGERFADEFCLKVHCEEHHAVQKSYVGIKVEKNSKLTACDRNPQVLTRADDGIEDTDKLPSEFTDMAGVCSATVERDNKSSPHNGSRGDNNSCSSDADNGTLEADNCTVEADNCIVEADNARGLLEADITTSCKGIKKSTVKRDKSASQVDKSSTDRDHKVEDNIAIDATAEKLYKCAECGRAYSRKHDLIVHHRIGHDVRVFKCETCDKQFSFASALKRHKKIHSRAKPYQCMLCDRGFLRKSALDHHNVEHKIESLISQYKSPNEPPVDASQIIPVEGKTKMFECDICGLKLNRPQKYVDHMLKHKGIKPYVCVVCGEAYSVKGLLTAHYRVHLGEEEYKCQECGKEFYCSSHLKVHSRKHTGEKPFMCSICGQTFVQQNGLTLHMKRHNNDFAFICDDCGKACISAAKLKYHRRIHTGEKPYVCPTCGKCFRDSSRFKEHKLIHTGEKPYVCKICGKAYNQRHCLKEHATKHADNPGLLCSVCGKSCKHKSALNAHIRTVHQEISDEKVDIESLLNI